MRILYSIDKCIGSTKGEEFLIKNDLKYVKKNLLYYPLTEKEVNNWHNSFPNGIIEIINHNAFYIIQNKINLKNLNKKQLVDLVIKHPEILSFPIIVQNNEWGIPKKIIVGFNPNEWVHIQKELDKKEEYYNNLSKNYIFSYCCYFDEVKAFDNNTKKKYGK